MAEDLSKLSDQELDKIIADETTHGPSPSYDFSTASDEDLDKIISEEVAGPSLGQRALGVVSDVGQFIDKYTGAPTRSALSELTRTDKEFGKPEPSIIGNIGAAGSAFVNQIGKDPSLAPTGAEIAEKRFGLRGTTEYRESPRTGLIYKEKVSPAQVAGFAIDAAADPLNFIPGETIAKGVAKGTAGMAKPVFKWSAKAAEIIPGVKPSKEVAKSLVESTTKAISDIAKPSQAKDFPELLAIADKNGIDITKAPESVEFGKNSIISRGSRVQAESAIGEPRLNRHNEWLGEVSQAFERKSAEIGNGPPMSLSDAGNHISDAYNRSVDEMFKEAENGYSDLVKTYPGLMLSKDATEKLTSKLNGIEKFAKGRSARGISATQRAQGKELLNATSAIRRTNGSVKQAVEVLRDVGEVAFKKAPMGQIPADTKKMRDLYFTLRDSIYDTVRTDVKDGVAVEGALKISNGLMTEFFNKSKFIDDVLSNDKLAPEIVFNRVTATTSQIENLKEVLTPGDFAKVKNAYLESLIKRDELGNINFNSLQSALQNRKNKEVISKLFTPEEIKELGDISKLGERTGLAIMSTAGSAPGNLLSNLAKSTQQAILNEPVIEAMKSSARNRGSGLNLPQSAPQSRTRPWFGPGAIGPTEAFGLRLPQQLSRDNERKR